MNLFFVEHFRDVQLVRKERGRGRMSVILTAEALKRARLNQKNRKEREKRAEAQHLQNKEKAERKRLEEEE